MSHDCVTAPGGVARNLWRIIARLQLMQAYHGLANACPGLKAGATETTWVQSIHHH